MFGIISKARRFVKYVVVSLLKFFVIDPFLAVKKIVYKITWENPVTQHIITNFPLDYLTSKIPYNDIVLELIYKVSNFLWDNPGTRFYTRIKQTSPKKLIVENSVSQYGLELVKKPVNSILENDRVVNALISTENHINNYLMKTPLVKRMSSQLIQADEEKESLIQQIQQNRETIMRFQEDRKKEFLNLTKELKEQDAIIQSLKSQLNAKELLLASAKNTEKLKMKISELTSEKASMATSLEDLKRQIGKDNGKSTEDLKNLKAELSDMRNRLMESEKSKLELEERSRNISKELEKSATIFEENTRLKKEMEKIVEIFNNEPNGSEFLNKLKSVVKTTTEAASASSTSKAKDFFNSIL